MTRFTRGAAVVLAGTVMAGSVFATGPAFAEGSWNSSLSSVAIGKSSRSWQDSHRDNVKTTTTFSGCRITGNASGFSSATVTLYDERGLLPDQNMGSKTNRCGKSDWGVMSRSDRYHWTISKLNGASYENVLRLSVSSIRQTY